MSSSSSNTSSTNVMRRWTDFVNFASASILLIGAVAGLVTGTLLSPQIKSLFGVRPEVTLTSPEPGAVDRKASIRGTAKHIPQGHYVWLLVEGVDAGGRYYPYEKPCTIGPKVTLLCDDAYIGADNDYGKRFNLIAVDADQDAYASLLEYNASDAKRRYEGIPNIPRGSTVLGTVRLERRSK